MIDKKIVTVVLPAYNAEKTLEQTYNEIPFDIVDHVILVDDKSSDQTLDVAKRLNIKHIVEHQNIGCPPGQGGLFFRIGLPQFIHYRRFDGRAITVACVVRKVFLFELVQQGVAEVRLQR